MLRLASAHNPNQTYAYNYTQLPPACNHGRVEWGAFHSSDIPVTLHNDWNDECPLSDSDEQLSHLIGSIWKDFTIGVLPRDSISEWPSFENGDNSIRFSIGERNSTDLYPYAAEHADA
jgi:carboxylesterase type B